MLLTGRAFYPRNKLTTRWVEVLSDFPEARIASGLASIGARGSGLRDHLDAGRKGFAWTGRDLPARLTSVIDRRLMKVIEGEKPFWAVRLTPAEDVRRFLFGEVDDELIEEL